MATGRGRARSGGATRPNGIRSAGNGAVLAHDEEPKPRANGARNAPILLQPKPATRPAVVARFGPLLGPRFARANVEVLGQAYAAYSGLRKAAAVIRGRGANIFTQWIGDPDALGSAVVLKAILTSLGAKEVRILTGALGHPQTRNLAERCHIRLQDPNADRLPKGLHCMVDTSPPLGMTNTGRVDPITDYFFVADHHADRDDVEANCRDRGVKRVRLAFVGLPVGSTSSFLAVMAGAFGVLDKMTPEEKTAAALGIYTDTSALLHGATPLDFRMFELLTHDEEARDILDELRDYRVPPEWYMYRSAAFENMEMRGTIRIAPVGYVREDHRDVIAEIANDLLRIDNTSIGIAVAVTERGTEVSVRADSRLLGNDQGRIVNVIDHLLSYAFPGLSGFKHQRRPPHRVEGGACVPHSLAQERLWKLGAAPSGKGGNNPVLEHCRACAQALIAALEDLKFARPEEIEGLL
jgi:nanoRNase/pAp phosphatase (c-di-AMP/oligoRNAs hydrolase)